MEYTIILESAASFKPNWEKATSQLSAKVNAAIGAGGGLSVASVSSR